MFEKEAKERARKLEENQTLGVYDNEEEYARDRGWNDGEVAGYEEGFQDGAEFGYKKCQEEMQKNGLALQSDMDRTIEQNMALKKACEETQELLDKQIEATYKVVEEKRLGWIDGLIFMVTEEAKEQLKKEKQK